MLLVAPAARADAWLAMRAELGKRADAALGLFPGLAGELKRCGIDARREVDRVELTVGDGQIDLRAKGSLTAKKLACVLGREPGADGAIVKDGPRVVTARGWLRLSTPGVEPRVGPKLAARLAGGRRALVAIAFALEGADGLLAVERRGGILRVRLPARTGVKPAIAAIKNAWEKGVRVDARGTEITVRAPRAGTLMNIARAAFIDVVAVGGGSMRPTLGVGETVLIVRKPIAGPARPGDVVFYNDPDAPVSQVKRVVALAGERVQVEGNRVAVNDQAIRAELASEGFVFEDAEGQTAGRLWRERLADAEWRTMRAPDPDEDVRVDLVVPEGTLYVLGDARDSSRDSRHTGPVPFAAVLGRAAVIAWAPLQRWQRIGKPVR